MSSEEEEDMEEEIKNFINHMIKLRDPRILKKAEDYHREVSKLSVDDLFETFII